MAEVKQEGIAGVSDKQLQTCEKVIVDGFASNKTPADIKDALFGTGIGYSAVAKVYKQITELKNLVVSNKSIKEKFVELTKDEGFEFTDWPSLEGFVRDLVKQIPGSTDKRIFSLIKEHCLANEINAPIKPPKAKKSGGGSKLKSTYVSAFAGNPTLTKNEFRKQLEAVTKTGKNAYDYANSMYETLYMVCNKVAVVPAKKLDMPKWEDIPQKEEPAEA